MGPDGKAAPQGSAENKAAKLLGEELENLWRWAEVCWLVRQVPQLLAVLRRPDLPDKEAVELLLRYETKVERQFYRALNELELLQRRRAIRIKIRTGVASSHRDGFSRVVEHMP